MQIRSFKNDPIDNFFSLNNIANWKDWEYGNVSDFFHTIKQSIDQDQEKYRNKNRIWFWISNIPFLFSIFSIDKTPFNYKTLTLNFFFSLPPSHQGHI